MGIEIERKFLIAADGWRAFVTRSETLRQGYLVARHELSVRIRLVDDGVAWLTIKHGGAALLRAEYEYPIPVDDAVDLLRHCGHTPIAKRRSHLDLPGGDWVVDEFEGRHSGLVLAEIEFARVDAPFDKPDWLGEEVTGDARYYNSALAALPDGGEI